MFAKPDWFRKTGSTLGVAPLDWRGWAYSGSWLAVMALPALTLLAQAKLLETAVWLAVTGGLLALDLRQVRQQLAAPSGKIKDDDVLIIDENETESARFATRKFDLKFRN